MYNRSKHLRTKFHSKIHDFISFDTFHLMKMTNYLFNDYIRNTADVA
jgi:hypothetical protein